MSENQRVSVCLSVSLLPTRDEILAFHKTNDHPHRKQLNCQHDKHEEFAQEHYHFRVSQELIQ